jgi:thioesterase domain-containing protein
MTPMVVNDLEHARTVRGGIAAVTAALPDQLAVDDGTRTMTYAELSNRVARADGPTMQYAGAALTAFRGSADAAWESLLTGPVATVDVPGDHVTMLRRPYVGALGAQLGRALDDHAAGG